MKAIGIDLGTTFSCVGVWQNGLVHIIPDELGNKTIPSYVSFTDTERLIGVPAFNDMTNNLANTIYHSKRLIGRSYFSRFIQDDIKIWPFKVIDC